MMLIFLAPHLVRPSYGVHTELIVSWGLAFTGMVWTPSVALKIYSVFYRN